MKTRATTEGGRATAVVVVVLALVALLAGGWWWSAARRDSDAKADVPPTIVEAPAPASPTVVVPEPLVETSTAPAVAPEEFAVAPASGLAFAELNGRAIAALEAREFELAVELFERCVAGAPEEPIFRGNLAEALARRAIDEHERTRPCEVCVEWMERAVELAPDREPLRKLLERWKKELETEKEFQRDRSVHFELSYDGWREQLLDAAPDVLDELERHYIDLALIFGLYPAERGRPRIPVVLYKRDEFTRITGLDDWAGGSYDGTIRVPIQEGRSLDAVLSSLLRHELIHAFVREAGGPVVPAWLNEGLAQWFQRQSAAEVASARRHCAAQPWIELDQLQRAFAALGDPGRIASAYAQSLALVEYIERTHGRGALLEMVRGCKAETSASASFEVWARLPLSTAVDDFRADVQFAR